ncbi:MFS transporter [Actinocatenispora rupis]|uniref:MFS transporter n=1 Tax=Actinocatenispora rupis TaxID=519421 RepID=A0A8J3ND52_9ACTN|nr:MFS transporter [Actinocatenispora rupis]GID14706.1 MFS transporter [Actinocatenispora rupis]
MDTATTAPVRPTAAGRTPLILAGFLLCIFAVGTAELLVGGLLPQIATAVHVSVARAGQLVTAYALGVVVGGPLITVLTARTPRKPLVLGLVAVFVAGSLISAASSSYWLLGAGRVLAALSQGTLFAVAMVVVTTVVSPERAGRAIAVVVSGLTLATVLGVPLGALLGHAFGWRTPFLAVAVLAAAGGAVLAVAMPRTPAPVTSARSELAVLRRRPVVVAIATTAVGFAGVGTVLTYLVPLLTRVSGFSAGVVSVLLLAYGAGSLVGNLVAGRLTDVSPTMTVRIVFLGLTGILAALPFLAPWRPAAVAAVLLFGLLATATIAPLQGLILRYAADAPTLSVAVNVSGFNLANALGSALGGGLVAAGALRWNGLAGALLALAGLGLSWLARPRSA